MVRCCGQLVVHDDGSVVGCTEEVCGRRCAGSYLPLRHAGSVGCRAFVPSGRCRHCDPVPGGVDPLVRFAGGCRPDGRTDARSPARPAGARGAGRSSRRPDSWRAVPA